MEKPTEIRITMPQDDKGRRLLAVSCRFPSGYRNTSVLYDGSPRSAEMLLTHLAVAHELGMSSGETPHPDIRLLTAADLETLPERF
jgi:hypothetical protein